MDRLWGYNWFSNDMKEGCFGKCTLLCMHLALVCSGILDSCIMNKQIFRYRNIFPTNILELIWSLFEVGYIDTILGLNKKAVNLSGFLYNYFTKIVVEKLDWILNFRIPWSTMSENKFLPANNLFPLHKSAWCLRLRIFSL